MPTAKELKEYLPRLIDGEKTIYGKKELIVLINAAYTDLIERELENVAKC